jgi:hypothetical protein
MWIDGTWVKFVGAGDEFLLLVDFSILRVIS